MQMRALGLLSIAATVGTVCLSVNASAQVCYTHGACNTSGVYAVEGYSTSSNGGGIYGQALASLNGTGIVGTGLNGVKGVSATSSGYGVWGENGNNGGFGVYGRINPAGNGGAVYADNAGAGWALFSNGDFKVAGHPYCTTQTTVTLSSDSRLKKNVQPLVGALDRLLK